MNLMAILKFRNELPLNSIFRGKSIALFYVKVWLVDFQDSVLEKNIPVDLFRRADFRFDLYFVIWLTIEKSIFG